jgi:hypothetical protein
MERYSQAQLAEPRAGVSEGEIDQLCDLGVLSWEDGDAPYIPGDVRQVVSRSPSGCTGPSGP